MSVDLDKLKISELKCYNFEQTVEVIDALEKVFDVESSVVDKIEKYRYYCEISLVIHQRIENNDFQELSNRYKKLMYLTRIKRLIASFSSLSRLNNSTQEKVTDAKDKQKEIEEKLQIIQNEILSAVAKEKGEVLGEVEKEIEKNKQSLLETQEKIIKELKNTENDISKKIEEEKKEVSSLERNTLSHVLSLMGIFSAVIVIIMSVILTATSWLNNADGASAIVAFTVPNLVALLSVFVLLSLIYLYTHKDSSVGENSNKRTKIKSIFAIVVITIILVISITLSIVLVKSINKVKEENIPHKQYVISLTDYKIIEIENSEKVKEKFFEVFLDDERYEFKYDEKYIHDGDRLYFCKEHNTLE